MKPCDNSGNIPLPPPPPQLYNQLTIRPEHISIIRLIERLELNKALQELGAYRSEKENYFAAPILQQIAQLIAAYNDSTLSNEFKLACAICRRMLSPQEQHITLDNTQIFLRDMAIHRHTFPCFQLLSSIIKSIMRLKLNGHHTDEPHTLLKSDRNHRRDGGASSPQTTSPVMQPFNLVCAH